MGLKNKREENSLKLSAEIKSDQNGIEKGAHG